MKTISLTLIFLLSVVSVSLSAQSTLQVNESRLHISSNTRIAVTGNINTTGSANNNGIINNEGDIELTGNWHNDMVYGDYRSTNGQVVFSGTSTQWLSGKLISSPNDNDSFFDIECNNPSGIALSNDMGLAGTLHFSNGTIDINNFDLTIGSQAAIQMGGSNKYIQTSANGSVRVVIESDSVLLLPVGRSSYNPITLTNYGLTDTFNVCVLDEVLENGDGGNPMNNNKIVNRSWLVQPENEAGCDLDLTVQWHTNDEGSAFDRDNCYVAIYDSYWQDDVTGQAQPLGGNQYNSARMNITGLSTASVGSGGALPIELLHFSALADDNQVRLQWATASELNNDYFEIFRSTDALNFEPILKLDGVGTSQTINNYTALDKEPFHGINYYKLKQVDFDGTFEYSKTVKVTFQPDRMADLLCYPNPATSLVNVVLPVELQNQTVSVKLYNLYGQMLLSMQSNPTDMLQLELENINLASGNYLLYLDGEEGYTATEQIMIVR